jgi:LDH2 family malate/lactate/ureidoglycolate dehydrogenase
MSIQVAFGRGAEVMRRALERGGLSAADAAVVSDALLDAEASGRTGHGFVRVPAIVARAAQAGSDNISVAKDRTVSVALDGGGALGYLVAHRAAVLAVERLCESPLVAVGCRGTSHAGAIGYYARSVALAGHAAMVTANCSAMIAPHAARRPVFGTNPIAFACPGPDFPFVVDLSPGQTTYGAILTAQQRGTQLPEGSAIDGSGLPTTDPAAAAQGALLAIGGAKGSALAFMVQVLSGPLCGAPAIPAPGTDYGFFLFAARMDLFADAAVVTAELTELRNAIHRAGAVCPGERSEARRLRSREEGFQVDEELWENVLALADMA